MSVSLRQRIFWWSAGSTLAILLIVFLFVDGAFRDTVFRDQAANILAGARLAEQVQSSEVDQSLERTIAIAATPVLRAAVETGDPRTIRENLETLLEGSGLQWLALSEPDGRLIAGTSTAPADRLGSPATAGVIAEARYYDTGDLWEEDGQLTQVHATGVGLGTTELRILLAGAAIGEERVERLASATMQGIAFVGSDRLVAVSEDLPEAQRDDLFTVWNDGGTASMTAAAERHDSQDIRRFRMQGVEYLGTAVALPDARGEPVGTLVVFRSLQEALAPARALRLTLLALALVGVLLAFASSFMLSRRVTRPVTRLIRETVRLGSGNLDDPIRPDRDDEIGALASGFEQMRVSLRGARADLLRAERLSAVGRAASAIVHDIRQPVTAIQGHVGLLRMDGDDPKQREEDLAIIERELARLNAMMSELLDFGRGAENVNPTNGRIHDLLEEVRTALRPILDARNVTLEVEEGFGGEWCFDYPRMRRVLENLVRNAAVVVPHGGVIWVRSQATTEGLRLEVQDTGPGIPDEVRDNLFEPFVTFGKKEGTGLGLAIVKAFTERNGGVVNVETSSAGTRFTLDFPGKAA